MHAPILIIIASVCLLACSETKPGATGGSLSDADADATSTAADADIGPTTVDVGPLDTSVVDPDSDAGPMCGGPLATCSDDESCCEGSMCVGNTCPPTQGAGVCTPPDRDGCGCGAVWDDCDTPGTTCLSAGCEYPGVCVTPSEMAAICNSADPGCFVCPFCEGTLCTEIPPDDCADANTRRTYTQEWLGCGADGGCQFGFTTEACPSGSQCQAGECVPTCQPLAPGEWVLPAGTWEMVEATVSADVSQAPIPVDGLCVTLGWDQYLNPLTINADGTFSGLLVTDYDATWNGCLVTLPTGAIRYRMDVTDCSFGGCYGHDTTPGKLGTLEPFGDGELMIMRQGNVRIQEDTGTCNPELGEDFPGATIYLRYSLTP